MDKAIKDFLTELASSSPVPGGGGASAIAGAAGAALASMAAELSARRPKYARDAAVYADALERTAASIQRLLELADEDERVFACLAKVYRVPKDEPGRADRLERALAEAGEPPMAVLEEVIGLMPVIRELSEKAAVLAVSDVGVAAAMCRAAMEGAALNVAANTRLMADRVAADRADERAERLLLEGSRLCAAVIRCVYERLGCGK